MTSSDTPVHEPFSNGEKLERLRGGMPGRYEFHLVQGESYEGFEAMIAEARSLALRFHGTCDVVPGTFASEESLRVEIPQRDGR
ncbi:MAG: hypothetical protein ACXWKW_07295 [Asticcacaulis sp.]